MKKINEAVKNIYQSFKSFNIMIAKTFVLVFCSMIFIWLLSLVFDDISDEGHIVLSAMFTFLMFIFIYTKSLKIDLKNMIEKTMKNINVTKILKLFLAALILQIFRVFLYYVLFKIFPNLFANEEKFNFDVFDNKLLYAIDCLNTIVLFPVVEEILFRKTLYSSLAHQYNEKKANIIQACIFSIYHLSVSAFLSHFMAGYILGIIYKKEKNIFPPIIFHGFINLIATIYIIIVYIWFY